MKVKNKFGLLKHFNMFIGVINIKDKGYGLSTAKTILKIFMLQKGSVMRWMVIRLFSISNTISFGKLKQCCKIVKRF